MSKSLTNYTFEEFPRSSLKFKFNRRQFFSTLAGEVQVHKGQTQGGSAYKLPQLGSLPDEQLACYIPMVVPDCTISVKEGFVWGQPPALGQMVKLFPTEPPALLAFNRFNGLTPLGAVGHRLAQEMGWERERGFAYARGLFLHLITLGVCLPK